MVSIDLIGRAERASVANCDLSRTAGAIIIGTIGFNAVLCFLNTRGAPISSAHVMLSEVILISGALFACRDHLTPGRLFVLTLIVAYTVIISTLRFANLPGEGFDRRRITWRIFHPAARRR